MPTPNDVSVQLYLGGSWVEQVKAKGAAKGDVFVAEGMTITQGQDGESSTRPGRIELTFNNDDLRYDPTLPTSDLYGIYGRNTIIRVQLGGTVRQTAELSAITVDRTPDHATGVRGRATADVVAEGLLRRLGRWTDPLRSPMWRVNAMWATSVGHWPFEDEQSATQAANTLSGGPPAALAAGVTLGDSDAPAGAGTAAALSSTTLASGTFRKITGINPGWQIAWCAKLPTIPGSATYYPFLQWTTSRDARWYWEINNTTFRVSVYARDGSLAAQQNVLFGAGADPNQWIDYRVKVTESAGTVTVELGWYPQSAAVLYGITFTFAGTTGALTSWTIAGNPVVDGARLVHLLGLTTGADNLQAGDVTASFNGYAGERSQTRFARLCAQEGLAYYTGGVAADTWPMGPQKPGKFLDLIEECARTDDALVYDEPGDIALSWFGRKYRYNQTPALTLAYPSQVAAAPKTVDDRETVNTITVRNASGSEATAVRATGRLSVQPPPAGVGEVRGQVDVNAAADATLYLRAGWDLAKGTLDRPRYQLVRVDLMANPGLAAQVAAVTPGRIIRITGLEAEPVDLVAIGITDRIGSHPRTVDYVCLPAEPWMPARYDNTTKRYDSRATTLNAGVTSAATTLVLAFPTPSDAWSTKAASQPYDVMIAGERIRVPVGGMGAVTGAGPYTQTITGATRAVNGVVKAQLAGAEVHAADLARYAL